MSLGPFRVAALVAAILATASPEARADDEPLSSSPGVHGRYRFEVGPEMLFGYAKPFRENGTSFGAGFGGTLYLGDGFISSIDDAVGVGVAFEFDVYDNLLVPVVLQWNFWLSPMWSVFVEPGIALGSGSRDTIAVPIIDLGGRLQLNQGLALTLRLGYPDFSLGFSFFL